MLMWKMAFATAFIRQLNMLNKCFLKQKKLSSSPCFDVQAYAELQMGFSPANPHVIHMLIHDRGRMLVQC